MPHALRPVRLAPCLLGLLLAATSVVAQSPDPDPTRFDQRILEFYGYLDERNSSPAEPIVFVGSSSIRLWKTAVRFPDLPVVNRGFGGSHISDVVHFLEQTVLRHRPKAIVFYAGDNDIAAGKSPEQVRDDYVEFVEGVHAVLPETPIIFLAIKPSSARWELWPVMQRANRAVGEFSESSPLLHVLDLADDMIGADGTPREELLVADGLHLDEAGYDIWTARTRSLLAELGLVP